MEITYKKEVSVPSYLANAVDPTITSTATGKDDTEIAGYTFNYTMDTVNNIMTVSGSNNEKLKTLKVIALVSGEADLEYDFKVYGALDEILETLENKFRTCSFISDSTNVVYGEDLDLDSKNDSLFPRLETLVTKAKCEGAISQRELQWNLRFGTAAYFRTDTDAANPTLLEMQVAAGYGKEIADRIYSFYTDEGRGNSPCTGFEVVEQYPEIFLEKELMQKTMSCIVTYGIKVLLKDTETL